MLIKVDAFAHALPPRLRDEVFNRIGDVFHYAEAWKNHSSLTDAHGRIDMLNESGIDLQVVTTPTPPLEELTSSPHVACELAQIANDSMADWVSTSPDRLVGVATISTLDMTHAAEEATRAVKDLGLAGVLLYADSTSVPPDTAALSDLYSVLEELQAPLWLHPWRSPKTPDYRSEEESKFLLFYVFGWPYETTLAMGRLVCGGVLERHPRMSVIVHHAGAMVPPLAKRMEHIFAEEWADAVGLSGGSTNDMVALFRRFYVDAVTYGSGSALLNSYEFFGPDNILFGTDAPWDIEGGRKFARDCSFAVETLPIPPHEKDKIWGGNALNLLRRNADGGVIPKLDHGR